jgi:hypothetical protein
LFQDDVRDVESVRLFADFAEVGELKGGGGSSSNHMDMGWFQRYLEQHNAGHIFGQLFNLEK